MQNNTVDTSSQKPANYPAWWDTERALKNRRAEILTAFERKEVFPTNELLEELATINIKLGEA